MLCESILFFLLLEFIILLRNSVYFRVPLRSSPFFFLVRVFKVCTAEIKSEPVAIQLTISVRANQMM